MNRFITYFDLLGYRNFLERNDSNLHKRVIEQFFVHIESALNQSGKYKQVESGVYINDLTRKTISFANYSDTVVLWTDGDSQIEFEELFKVSYESNWRMNLYHFPIRGSMIFDELFSFHSNSISHGMHVNTFYGKGLIEAHDLAENQNWAGMVIDQSVIEKIDDDFLIKEKCVRYDIPMKNGTQNLWAMKLSKKMNEVALENTISGLIENFKRHDKWDDGIPSLEKKLSNTIDFLKYLKEFES